MSQVTLKFAFFFHLSSADVPTMLTLQLSWTAEILKFELI